MVFSILDHLVTSFTSSWKKFLRERKERKLLQKRCVRCNACFSLKTKYIAEYLSMSSLFELSSNTWYFQVLLEQLTASPWNNILFMAYYGLVVEGLHCYEFSYFTTLFLLNFFLGIHSCVIDKCLLSIEP